MEIYFSWGDSVCCKFTRVGALVLTCRAKAHQCPGTGLHLCNCMQGPSWSQPSQQRCSATSSLILCGVRAGTKARGPVSESREPVTHQSELWGSDHRVWGLLSYPKDHAVSPSLFSSCVGSHSSLKTNSCFRQQEGLACLCSSFRGVGWWA